MTTSRKNSNVYANPLVKLLAETKIKNIASLKKQHLVKVNSSDLVKDVFQSLTQHDLLSAPVYDPNKGEYIGMVDMRDFVAFIMSIHMKGDPIVFTAERMSDLSGSNPFIPIDEETTLLEVLREFNIKRVHRLPVTKHSNATEILYQLSESALVELIAQNKDILGNPGQMTVKQLNLGGVDNFHQVIAIKETDTLLAAYSIIERFNIHGLPVLDKDGKIVGNISVRDLKYLVANDVSDASSLSITIRDFFATHSSHRPAMLTCKPSTKFIDVLTTLAESKVHRIHVVDTDGRPVDVISMSNVLDIILLFATGQRRR